MVFEQYKKSIFKNRETRCIWEVLHNEKENRILLKKDGKLVATKLTDEGLVECIDYKVGFDLNLWKMYSFQIVEMKRRLSNKRYIQKRVKYLRMI